MSEPPIGQRFSQVYLERGVPQRDSVRARYRLGSRMQQYRDVSRHLIADAICNTLGIPASMSHLTQFMRDAELRDVLDTITIVASTISETLRPDWRSFAAAVLKEEGLSYRLDERGGVHYSPDEEYERSSQAVVLGLAGARYHGALTAFEEGRVALAGVVPDTLTAVRRTFDAVENVFKMMTSEPRLGTAEITKKLKPRLAAIAVDRSADASKLLAESLSDWTNACHVYRHAPGEPDPSPPPLMLAVTLISAGAAFLRWLVDVDMNTL